MCQESDTSVGRWKSGGQPCEVKVINGIQSNLMLLKFVLTTSANFRFFLTQSDSSTVSSLSSATAPEETTATLE